MTLTHTEALAKEQSLLLDALAVQHSAEDVTFNPRGLQVYRANRAVLAERTLASTYPVTSQLIGAESFELLARYFWHQHPPLRSDMGQWGAELAGFLVAAPQLADEPFLGDVARVEWALHCAATASDTVLDTPSFVWLSRDDDAHPANLLLAPGSGTLESAYPVVSIINAHLAGQPTLGEVAELLRQGQGEYALVWRRGFKPTARTLSRAEYSLITALVTGLALEVALDQARVAEPASDFTAWLGAAVQAGLITGAARVASSNLGNKEEHHDKLISITH